MIRVLLADDHAMFRLGIRRILSTEEGIEVVGEVGDGLDVFMFLANNDVDVLVLDLSLPGLSGLEILRRLGDEAPRVTVVVLTMYPEDHFASSLIRQGAGAYITKSGSPDELVKAIRVVSEGRIYLTPKMRAIEEAGRGEGGPPHERLSPRENQVFMSLIAGNTVSETAHSLDLAVSTVSTLVSRIREKLDAGSVADLVLYAHRVGLLD
jgi:two-component system, NarL family, invasion response regulator UvrY